MSLLCVSCSLGITRLNVYAGMAGLYHIRERPVEEGPELPGLPYPPPGLGDNKKVGLPVPVGCKSEVG